MYDSIFLNLVFNIGLLLLIATFMSHTTLIKALIYEPQKALSRQLSLVVFFGLITLLSGYTGITINGASVNTCVIVILSAGLMCGPIVGMGTALIGSLSYLLFGMQNVTAVAYILSTLLEGILGCLFHKNFQAGEFHNEKLMLLAATSEICQMLFILAFTRPLEIAFKLVSVLALPMVVLNALGIVAFLGAFNHIFVEQAHIADSRIRLALQIAEQCLPHLRKGLRACPGLDTVTALIKELSKCSGIMVTNETSILAHSEEPVLSKILLKIFPHKAFDELTDLHTHVIEPDSDTLDNASARLLHRYVFVVAPLSYKNKVIGTLILAEKKKWLTAEAQVGFLDGLALLFSTQLELSQLDYHERLRKKAEFQMLQTQVNPHFLFNCLNTISYFCVEKPIRARELLLTLSQYYRYAIQNNSFFVELSDELRHITTYLELEKARFEERLILELEISQVPAVGCLVPSLILQPIIENAVHHGRDAKGNRFVSLTALPKNNGMEVIITDKGPGFPQEVLETFYAGEPTEDAVGLMNVHKRLLSLYGPEYGVKVLSSPQGTGITMFFPILSPEEVKELEVLACLS